MKVLFLLLLNMCHGFKLFMTNNPYKNTNWNQLQYKLKEKARDWFINRAEQNGIPWKSLYEKNKNRFDEINIYKEEVENRYISYPSYYVKPFHGYDEGNLNWQAALEAEAATLSISAGYWPDVNVYDTQDWMRNNVTEHINKYLNNNLLSLPKQILDVGCSIGISTEYLRKDYPNAFIHGVDLCPHFLGVAQHRAKTEKKRIHYFHANAENIPRKDESYDLIVCNFLFHELPKEASQNMLVELYRLLKNNGLLVIMDMDPKNLDKQLNNNPFRKWAFESTEPHIYDYYLRDTTKMMENTGLQCVQKFKNDPLNSLWIGIKQEDILECSLNNYENNKFKFSMDKENDSIMDLNNLSLL